MKKFNLNDPVKVKLTELGRQMIVDYYAQLREHFNRDADRNEIANTHIVSKTDKSGYTEFQMHDLMTYFGGNFSGSAFVGNTKMPFETMNILIDDSTLKISKVPTN